MNAEEKKCRAAEQLINEKKKTKLLSLIGQREQFVLIKYAIFENISFYLFFAQKEQE